jgi:AraC-like DNA-binding protein
LNELAAPRVLACERMPLPLLPAGLPTRAWPPVLATHGPAGPCSWHSHHALRFALALEGELRIRTHRQGKWESAAGVLTASDAEHLLDGQGAELLLVFLEPESAVGASFRAALNGPARLFSDAERKALTRDVAARTILRSGAASWARSAAQTLQLPPVAAPKGIHPRVRTLLRIIREGGIDEGTSLERLAGAVGLSPSRLMHVFTESLGIPLRPYLAWLRVQCAAIAIVSGSSLSDAAQAAGFSDAPHMSRTFRRMLGIAPSLLRDMRCAR